jgi:vesicle coat complex subunit
LLVFFSDNEDPMVRGLALRSLCGLRLESILEYVEKPLQKGLNDISAYVRKTAILGVLKVSLFRFSPLSFLIFVFL